MNKETKIININNYNIETNTTNIDFLENEYDSDEFIYKNKLSLDLKQKQGDDILRLKIYVKTKEEITDLNDLYKEAYNQIKAKIEEDHAERLILYKNIYKAQTFYTLDLLFKPKKLDWQF